MVRQPRHGRSDDARDRGRQLRRARVDRWNRAGCGRGAASDHRSRRDVLFELEIDAVRSGARAVSGRRRALVHAHRASPLSIATARILSHERATA